jgi:hypothetical protein
MMATVWLAAACGALAQALPPEWMDMPFGMFTENHPGFASWDGGEFTLSGSGSQNGMYGTNQDGGRFVFQPLSGDAELVACVEKVNYDGGARGRAGVMFRANNQREAATVIFYRAGFDNANPRVVRGQYRTAEAATMAWQNPILHLSNEWLYVRLVRQGDTFTSFYTTNDVPQDWQLYNTVTVAMPEDVNAGLFVSRTSSSQTQTVTNRFRQATARPLVSVAQEGAEALAVAWVAQPPGTHEYSGLTYTLSRGPSRDGPFEVVADGLTETDYTDTVAAGPTHYYRVDAVSAESVTNLIGVSGGRRIAFTETNLVASPAVNGYWAEVYTHGAEFVARTSRVVSAVLNTAVTNGTVLHRDGYRAYYTATLVPTVTDWYFFQTRFDDGGCVWLGEKLIINDTIGLGSSRLAASAPLWLEAGRAVTLRVYHVQNSGTAELMVQWARLGDKTFADIPLNFVSPLPGAWRSRDYGLPRQNGFAEYDFAAKRFTVTAGGGAAGDEHVAYQEIMGDFAMQTCVLSQSGPQKKAGLLVRPSWGDGAARAGCFVGDGELVVELREETGGAVATAGIPFPTAAPVWLKVEYVGGTLAFFCKENANDAWTSVTNLPLTLPLTVYAGVAAQSLDADAVNVAVFSETTRAGLSVAVAPEADTQLQMSAPDVNYGAATEMIVKHWDVSSTREALLRFDTRGMASARSAKLRLYLMERAPTGVATSQTLTVRRVLDGAWEEMSATWNNPPKDVVLPSGFIAEDDPLFVAAVKLPEGGTHLEVDMTEIVRDSARAGGKLSLLLHTSAIYNDTPAKFATREHADAAKRPALVCYGEGPVGLTAEPGAAQNEIALVWRLAETPDAVYTVKRASSAEGPFEVIAQNLTGYTYYDKGRTPGTRYHYTVTAVTPDWESPASPVVSALCDAVTRGTQEALSDVYVQAGGSRDSNLNTAELVIKSSFTDNTYQREAFIKFNVAGLASVQNARLRIMPKTSDEPGNGTKSLLTTYVDIEAFGSGDWSETAATWNNSPYGYALPLRAQDLTWPDQSRKVRFRIGPQGVPQEIDITPLVRRVARTSEFMTLHLYRIDSYTDNNCVLYSREDGTAARRPALLYALQRPGTPEAAFINGLVTVAWPPYAGATGYTLERATTWDGAYAVVASGLAERTYADRETLSGQSYFYRVIAVTAGGASQPSDPVSAVALGRRRIVATADTYIDQNGANNNYGANAELNLKAHRNGPCREDLFRFDVRGLEAVQSARFRLNVAPRDGGFIGGGVVVYDATGSVGAWDEYTVTWNQPPKGYARPTTNSHVRAANELARVSLPHKVKDSGTHVTFVEADATAAVRAAAAAGRDLTLLVCGDDTLAHSQAFFAVATRENAADERRPALLCATASAGNPAVWAEAVASNRTVTVSWWPVNGAVTYTVTRIAPGGAESVVAEGITGTSVSDAGLWSGGRYAYTYRIDAVYSDGSAGTLVETEVRVPLTFERRIVDDSWAQGGQYSNTVNGAANILGVKNDSGDTARETYLRIDLGGLPPVKGASLDLTAASFNTDQAFTMVAEEVADTGWTETGANALTWTTARGAGATATQAPPEPAENEAANRVSAQDLVVGSVVSFDITRLVKAAQARGQPTLVIHLYSADPGAQKMMWFHSSEAADMGDQPKVIFTMSGYPPQGGAMILR